MGARFQSVLNGALDQADRLGNAPDFRTVRLDDRRFERLLAFGAEVGALIRFHNLGDQADGDWARFFSDDPSLRLAILAALDLGAVDRRLQAAASALRREAKHRHFEDFVRPLLASAGLLDGRSVEFDDLESAFLRFLRSRRRDALSEPLERLHAHFGGRSPWSAFQRARDALDASEFDALLRHLEDLGDSLLLELERRQRKAQTELIPSLGGGRHNPQAALYIAFASLFRHAQDTLNRFPQRLIDFYYRQVFEPFEPPGGAVPTTAAIAEGPVENVDPAPALAAPSRVPSLAGLRVLRIVAAGPLERPHFDAAPARVLEGAIALKGDPPALAAPFPLFGCDEATFAAVKPETLGFTLSGPVLWLQGGDRTVDLTLNLSSRSLAELAPSLKAIAAAAGDMETGELLRRVFEQGFDFSRSGPAGWLPLAYEAIWLDGPPRVVLRFRLSPDSPPLAEAPPGDGQPALRAVLRQDPIQLSVLHKSGGLHAYTVLSRLALESLSIDVHVSDLGALALTTPDGPADPNRTVLLFGAQAWKGANLDIAAPELFVKGVENLEASLTWAGLPASATGFAGYYQGYRLDADGKPRVYADGTPAALFDNTSFRVAATGVNCGFWNVGEVDGLPPLLYLFETGDADPGDAAPNPAAPVNPVTVLKIPTTPATPPADRNPSGAAVRLTLAEPDYGFGAALFSRNTMLAASAQSLAAANCMRLCASSASAASPESRADPLAPLTKLLLRNPQNGKPAAWVAAMDEAASALVGEAKLLIQDAIAKGGAGSQGAERWLASLEAAISAEAEGFAQSLRRRLPPWPSEASQIAATIAPLKQWIEAHGKDIGAAGAPALIKAGAALAAAEIVAGAGSEKPATEAGASAALNKARSALDAAAAAAAQACLDHCLKQNLAPLPNPPWQPSVSRIAISYTASAALPGGPLRLERLLPFGAHETAAWPSGEQALFPRDCLASLLIQLSEPAQAFALDFGLSARPGPTPLSLPPVAWTGWDGVAWREIAPRYDATLGLQSSGAVGFELQTPTDRIRVCVRGSGERFPVLTALSVGPPALREAPRPGADFLDAAASAASIAPVVAPPASEERPALDADFLARASERLRHKGFAVDAFDYASLALSQFPSIWRASVIPATEPPGRSAPGSVWLVVAPAKGAPHVADPATPYADPALLERIKTTLRPRAGAFVKLFVTNPTYVRLKVTVSAFFQKGVVDDPKETLSGDLVRWLSPWPDAAFEPRPDDYFTERRIAEFVRRRPYVKGIASLSVDAATPPGAGLEPNAARFFTTASRHVVSEAAGGAGGAERRAI